MQFDIFYNFGITVQRLNIIITLLFLVMLRKILFTGLSFTLLISCKKTDTTLSSSTKTQTSRSFEKIFDQGAQRMAFSLLSSDEQVNIAKSHIDFCINYFHLNSNQINVLNTTKQNLSKIYQTNDPEHCPELIQLENDIRQYFSQVNEATQQLIFDSMVNSEEGVANMPIADPNTPTNCNCSTQSNWCSGWGQGSVVNCNTSACNITHKKGCGTFWGYSCKGKCTIGN